MDFKTRFIELRKENGLSQVDIAKKLNISKVSVWQWENGFYEPSNQRQNELADYFNVSLDYLMGRTDQRRPIEQVTENDFMVAFSNLQGDLTEEDKQFILKMAQGFAASNEAKKKNK